MSEMEYVFIVECEKTGYEAVHRTEESAVTDAYDAAVEYTQEDSDDIEIQDMRTKNPDGELVPRPGGMMMRMVMPDSVIKKQSIHPDEDEEIETRHQRGSVTVRRAELH